MNRPFRALLVVALTLSAAPIGCVTREVVDSVYNRQRVEVILVEHRRGSKVVALGLSQPARISEQRLANILGSVEIRGREAQLAGIRYIFDVEQLPAVSAALAYGLKKASPDQRVAIRMTSKVMQHGIFDRKFITSFVAYVRDDLLFLHISRVDWRVPDRTQKTSMPLPRIDEHPMNFKVVPTNGMFTEGNYAVSVDWSNPLFKQMQRRAEVRGKGERTILLEDDSPPEREPSALPSDVLSRLTPAQLRQLADLEEARQQGKLTEGHYRRLRQKIFDEARKSH